MMKILIAIYALIFGGFSPEPAHANALFGYTHMQPSPHTLPGGRLVYGTELAYGVTDFFQVGTNVIRDAFQFYNASAKVSLLDFPEFALSPTFGFETYNLNDISDRNPDLQVTSWMPGVTTAFAVTDDVAWFLAGNLNLTQTKLVTSGIETSGLIRGATMGSDVSWAYNRNAESGSAPATKPGQKQAPARPKKSTTGNVLSGGVSYDITYKLFGVGISHHWPGFHLGVHYYPGATKFPFQPIIAGGGAIDF